MRRIARVLGAVLLVQTILYLGARAVRNLLQRPGHPDPLADAVDLTAFMDTVEFGSQAEALQEVRVRNVLGHVALDLTEARLAPDGATVEVETTLASTSLLVARGWRVVLTGEATASEHHVAATPEDDLAADAPVLRVVARSRLGALTITMPEPSTVPSPRSEAGSS